MADLKNPVTEHVFNAIIYEKLGDLYTSQLKRTSERMYTFGVESICKTVRGEYAVESFIPPSRISKMNQTGVLISMALFC